MAKGAPKGNTYNRKFKTPAQRKKLCTAWCEHISQGYSKESFSLCDPQTFRWYKEKFPKDFDTKKIAQAESDNRMFWEKAGIDGLWGGKKFNPTVWIFNIKNRFPQEWRDSHDVTSGGEKINTLNDLLTSIDKRKS